MSIINQDTFFTRVFQKGLSDPTSKAWLPGILIGSSDPCLNPFTLESIDLGNQDLGNGISLDVGLSSLSISGLPNVSVSPDVAGNLQLAGLTINFTAQFCALNPPPTGIAGQISLSCQFVLSNPAVGELTGNLTTEVSQVSLQGVLLLSGSGFADITITFTELSVIVPATATISPKVTFNGTGGFWAGLFEDYLKKADTVQAITGQINSQITAVLTKLSSSVTDIIRADLQKQIGE